VAAGDLDPTFGAGGIVLLPAAGTATVGRHSLRVLADGGVELIVLDRVTTSTTVRVARLLLPDGARIDDEVVTVATEPTHAAFGNDGDVWVLDGSGPALRLSRFSRNGGVVTENGGSLVALSRVSELVPLPDGGMLAVGTTDRAASGLQRFDASAAADATFGGGPPLPVGLALGPRPADGIDIDFRTAAPAENGSILVAGTRYEGLAFNPAVLAYDATGRLNAFGHSGSATVAALGSGATIAAVPGGGALVGNAAGGVALLDARGVQDPRYSARLEDPRRPGLFSAFTVAANGEVTGVGVTGRGYPAPVVYRLRADGAGDARFAGTGLVVTLLDAHRAQNTGYYAFASLPADRITAAGTACRQPDACDVVVARYVDVAD